MQDPPRERLFTIMMPKKVIILIIALLIGGFVLIAGSVRAASNFSSDPTPQVTTTLQAATADELARAYAEWAASKHADTYDEGYGANTTCARCKAPQNYDLDNLAQENALDCFSCKRTPGEPRPELEGGVPVAQADWMNIGCSICHQPIGDSYATSISYWDQANRSYVAVENISELCAKCHEGSHGFEVTEEQEASIAHNHWQCNQCHGNHGAPSACTDCHDPQAVSGAAEHAQHPSVNCTACHDAGSLVIWQEEDPSSPHFSDYVPIRFAHALTSWPSHNLSKTVDCTRCHHPKDQDSPVLVQEVGCQACHAEGASLFWCEYFNRDQDPNAIPLSTP